MSDLRTCFWTRSERSVYGMLDHQAKAFTNIKKELFWSVELAIYNPMCKTIIRSDAWRNVIDAALLHVQPDGSLRSFYAASPALTDAVQQNTTIELAIASACETFRDYIAGVTVSIQNYHKLLVASFSDAELSKMPCLHSTIWNAHATLPVSYGTNSWETKHCGR